MNLRTLASFATLQALLWGLASLLFFRVNGFYTQPLGLVFTVVFIVGHCGLFAWGAALVCAPFYAVGPRTLRGVCIGLNSLISIFWVIDWVVYSQYRFHIGLAMLEMFFGPAGREIFVFSGAMWALTLLGVGVLIGLTWALTAVAQKWAFSTRTLGMIGGVWAMCFLLYNGLYAWGKFNHLTSIVPQRSVLPIAYPMSANRQLEKWGFVPSHPTVSVEREGDLLVYPKHPLTCAVSQPAQNILLILVDSLRADMLTPEVMPRTSAWGAQHGVSRFTNHLSGSNATTGGVFSLFYGLPHSYWDDFTSAQIAPLVWQQARANGYTPAIFASSKLNSPAFHRNVFLTVENLRLGSSGKNSVQRDEDAVNGFLEFLDTRRADQPFFGFVFLDAPHAYEYPEGQAVFTPAKPINYLTLTRQTDPTPYFNQYKNAVYFADGQIDRILRALQEKGVLQHTVVIITGDHGQELNDSRQNYWGHNSNFTDYQTKVPLVVYAPGRSGGVYDYRTTHYDIAPTLLQTVFGCTNPADDYALGRNLFDPTPRPFTLFFDTTARVVRVEDRILVLNHFGTLEQYDAFLHPLDEPIDSSVVKEALRSFTGFYK